MDKLDEMELYLHFIGTFGEEGGLLRDIKGKM